MIKTLKQINNIKITMLVNTFIYYFKKLWLVGKCLPDSLYGNYTLKRTLSVIAFILKQLWDLGGKVVYVSCFVALPILMMGSVGTASGEQFSMAVSILFFMNCVGGSLADTQVLGMTREKITCIRYMRMEPRQYVQASLFLKYVPFFIYYLPCLMVLSFMYAGALGVTQIVARALIMWLAMIAFRMMGEALQLLVFDRTGNVISRSMLMMLVLGAVLVLAYASVWLGWYVGIASILFHPVCIAIWLGLGAFSFYYIAFGYKHYHGKLSRSIDEKYLLENAMEASAASSFKDVEMNEKDVDTLDADDDQHIQGLTGYSYLNALFFARHRRQLLKPVYIRLICVAAVFAIGVVLCFMLPDMMAQQMQNISSYLPTFVFIMYTATVAEKACRAMFYNCDISMLRYAYYREPRTMLKSFRVRLMYVSLYNLAVGAAICAAMIILCLILGLNAVSLDMTMFCGAILLMSVLFSVHHLFMYYVFQPYSESLAVKNPLFQVINVGMYLVCFACLRMEMGGLTFAMGVLGFTIAYIAVALCAVYRFAPTTFRIK